MIVRSKKRLLAQMLASTGCGWLLRRMGPWSSWNGLLVLNYHRIGTPGDSPWDHDLWSCTQEEFDWQVRYLKSHFDIISPSDLDQVSLDSRDRFVMITFDDGYRDNYEMGFKVLKSHGVPATFFLATGFLDQPHLSWWDETAWIVKSTKKQTLSLPKWLKQEITLDPVNPHPAIRQLLKTYKSLNSDLATAYLTDIRTELEVGETPHHMAHDMWMTWDMAREMQVGGMNFGSHTVSHPIMSRIPLERQRWEVAESRRRIGQELGTEPVIFSYPVGGQTTCTDETITCLQELGVKWAFRFGVPFRPDAHRDHYQVPRLPVERTMRRSEFKAITTLPQVFGTS